jgi:hypothetical protein
MTPIFVGGRIAPHILGRRRIGSLLLREVYYPLTDITEFSAVCEGCSTVFEAAYRPGFIVRFICACGVDHEVGFSEFPMPVHLGVLPGTPFRR